MSAKGTISAYKRHFIRLARYHKWANEKLFHHVRRVNEEDYRADAGLFFRSIHGTLNHMLLADKLWYSRLTGQPETEIPNINSYWAKPATEWENVITDRTELEQKIFHQSQLLLDYVEKEGGGNDENIYEDIDFFDSDFSYKNTKGVEFRMNRGEILDHIFNHGTHHRGQITAVLTRLDPSNSPEIDLLYFIREDA